jgi:hypothetical protein
VFLGCDLTAGAGLAETTGTVEGAAKPARGQSARPLHPLDFAVDRYRFQFSMIASYLTGFLISGVGFGPIATANSRAAAFGGCGRMAAAVVAAASKAIATNAVTVR